MEYFREWRPLLNGSYPQAIYIFFIISIDKLTINEYNGVMVD